MYLQALNDAKVHRLCRFVQFASSLGGGVDLQQRVDAIEAEAGHQLLRGDAFKRRAEVSDGEVAQTGVAGRRHRRGSFRIAAACHVAILLQM